MSRIEVNINYYVGKAIITIPEPPLPLALFHCPPPPPPLLTAPSKVPLVIALPPLLPPPPPPPIPPLPEGV